MKIITYITFILSITLLANSCNSNERYSVIPDEQDSLLSTDYGDKKLNISPISQQTHVWCWAAVSEMLFRYYGYPNLNLQNDYQCGIVGAYFGPNSSCWYNCYTCVTTIGSLYDMNNCVLLYPNVCNYFGLNVKLLKTKTIPMFLNDDEIRNEINRDRPIIACIGSSKSFRPELADHVTTIIGYKSVNSELYLYINDPYPYFLTEDPYLSFGALKIAPGQYLIKKSTFIYNLSWKSCIYRIEKT